MKSKALASIGAAVALSLLVTHSPPAQGGQRVTSIKNQFQRFKPALYTIAIFTGASMAVHFLGDPQAFKFIFNHDSVVQTAQAVNDSISAHAGNHSATFHTINLEGQAGVGKFEGVVNVQDIANAANQVQLHEIVPKAVNLDGGNLLVQLPHLGAATPAGFGSEQIFVRASEIAAVHPGNAADILNGHAHYQLVMQGSGVDQHPVALVTPDGHSYAAGTMREMFGVTTDTSSGELVLAHDGMNYAIPSLDHVPSGSHHWALINNGHSIIAPDGKEYSALKEIPAPVRWHPVPVGAAQ